MISKEFSGIDLTRKFLMRRFARIVVSPNHRLRKTLKIPRGSLAWGGVVLHGRQPDGDTRAHGGQTHPACGGPYGCVNYVEYEGPDASPFLAEIQIVTILYRSSRAALHATGALNSRTLRGTARGGQSVQGVT